MSKTTLRVTAIISLLAQAQQALCQEIGDVESYGGKGKLYYSFRSQDASVERFLLSKQSFAGEDGGGFRGDINVVYTYYDGAFEMRLISYIVSCTGEGPLASEATTYQGDFAKPINSRTVDIKISVKQPNDAEKDEYNLYWAVCKGIFQKYK